MPSRKPAFVIRLSEAVRLAGHRRRDQRLLRAMSDRDLCDLGVGRSQIPALLEPLSDAGAPPHARRSHGPCAGGVPPAVLR
ncbi:DUF1127 domain-containing protein [Variovorax sp. J22R187]|nr:MULTISPECIES: DUF1127 domain-containing protein [unclassified Variovorax]MDM0021708.1 DUF1127 domain-containing protein [Variovorax sp. J22R187]MDM0028037.1 DUF1127 domain-containing protein [Variovorax sp. J31P216]